MAPTPHHRYHTHLTGPIPPRSPRLKTHRHPSAATASARYALERLWRLLPEKITHEVRPGGAYEEIGPKTIELVAGRAWAYVKHMQKAAWARGVFGEETYGGMEGKIAGGAR